MSLETLLNAINAAGYTAKLITGLVFRCYIYPDNVNPETGPGWAGYGDSDSDLVCAIEKAVQHAGILPATALIVDPVRVNRVIVDMTSGLFNGATSVLPLEVLVIDTDDPEHVRANVPHFGDSIWASTCSAEVNPEEVNAAFDGITWLEENEWTACGGASASSPT
jgi:hypothetical protein